MVELILASASPRRAELLQQIGIKFRVEAAAIDESRNVQEQPFDLVTRLAGEKAKSKLPCNGVVLAADTIVLDDDAILGKPTDRDHAVDMLRRLANRTHRVVTAICLTDNSRTVTDVVSTLVTLRPITQAEAEFYWESGEPLDKAGGFAIQGLGAVFVKNIQGSYSNVVGLPLFETAAMLDSFGIQTLNATL
ncbi:MAG TPA: septum formation inhibitor Maf [Gammaproteobacteria bacterium]|nr:septum formation inhibitor Maf [Gammaproteobacteria bacterium]HIK70576.1 septum formation inhibitor Maf [Pseudomonadales bacterium]